MKIDVTVVLAALSIALLFIGMVGGAFLWMVKASIKPLEVSDKAMLADMKAFKKVLDSLVGKVKSEKELESMIDTKITLHEKECRHYRQTETGTFVMQRPPVASNAQQG